MLQNGIQELKATPKGLSLEGLEKILFHFEEGTRDVELPPLFPLVDLDKSLGCSARIFGTLVPLCAKTKHDNISDYHHQCPQPHNGEGHRELRDHRAIL